MKIGGVTPQGPAREYLVLPRPGAEDLVFIAEAVSKISEFETLIPFPKAKSILVKGGWKDNVDDPAYLEALEKRHELRMAWIVLKSLEPSNIEWDTIKMDKPSTWLNWDKDLMAAGLTEMECQRVLLCVTAANCLNEAHLEEARQSFLRGLAKESELSSGQSSEQGDTPSGEPANG